jgi:hypothetical protein
MTHHLHHAPCTDAFAPLLLGDLAPDFAAAAAGVACTSGSGGRLGVLFSHPADFRPCASRSLEPSHGWPTTLPLATRRSPPSPVDAADVYRAWIGDLEETQDPRRRGPAATDARVGSRGPWLPRARLSQRGADMAEGWLKNAPELGP